MDSTAPQQNNRLIAVPHPFRSERREATFRSGTNLREILDLEFTDPLERHFLDRITVSIAQIINPVA